eukprot:CAMPEP_0183351038 /NCGR_PEP_ID=MMETSP0164_2-20130417/23324_1 /TAXON_ID=221442 /ORGANISM="Coccolithus pelagicus ssp braarudi, Strain PLY182g" /LENGTH=406 /DNA_ID=CAMNT_0025523129 /DNA_START=110 /DNA_END=1330 /DNA_ORIENTATION=-
MSQSSTNPECVSNAQSPHEVLSRASTLESELNTLDPNGGYDNVTSNWALRPAEYNDSFLRGSFSRLLKESEMLPVEQRLVAYDACDEHEVKAGLGMFRKRLDARRNTKPKKANKQLLVCTPFDPDAFNFSKIRNPRERILQLRLHSGMYTILSNKFPLFPKHMLLVAQSLVPQQMTLGHLVGITELLQACSLSAYFNSWCASASVNHFHCHLIDELPPTASLPLVPGPLINGQRCLVPQGFPGFCYVFEASTQLFVVDAAVRAMQEDNQPHNMLFTPRRSLIYVFPKPLERPERSFELYPETVGGPELIGSFTVYNEMDYDALTQASAEELCRINTAPLPSRLLRRGGNDGVDDGAVQNVGGSSNSFVPSSRGRPLVPASRSVDFVPGAWKKMRAAEGIAMTATPA